MPPEERDLALLWDMLQAAYEVRNFVAGVSARDYAKDRMRQRAVERSIEIVGEAARGISKSFKAENDAIAWRPIIAQRHIIAHEYGEVLQERVWRVATIHIPVLIEQLESLTKPP
jgi:uncharacterized protein with HEPN domain